ncbi:MAG TPA: MSMEG_4193 family putative phosphomutase [Acidimicrobiales bacterium]|nr:MSMEG_4193 family putative phosphomutase [Acidimicrobiales bacterium]
MPTAAPATPDRRPARRKPAPHPPTLLLIVRHGATPTTGKILPGRAPGLHLADRGHQQASAVAERLRVWSEGRGDARVAAVYASPLERTRETAAPIAKALGLKVRAHRGLLECDFGEWTGAELKKLAKTPEWATVQRYPSGFRFPGGESFVAMQARMVDALAELCRRHPGQAVVAVSHADPIKAAVADALGSHLDLFQRIVISPCSLTAVSYGPTGPTVLAVNSTAALADLVPS